MSATGEKKQDPGVVHEDVEPAVALLDVGDGVGPGLLVGDVEVPVPGGLAELVGELLALVVEDVAEQHLRALGHEPPRGRGALAPRGTGDDGDLARQPSCGCSCHYITSSPRGIITVLSSV